MGLSIFEATDDVRAYVEATAGLDARRDIEHLRGLVGRDARARVLELGSGGGVDLARLSSHFDAVGSDPSAAARRWIADQALDQPPAVLDLRAEHLGRLRSACAQVGDRLPHDWCDRIDVIFSNKVLHLLDATEHRRCLAAQALLLGRDGIAMHLYWAPRVDRAPQVRTARGAADQNPAAREPAIQRADADDLRQQWLKHFTQVDIQPRSELAHHDLLRVTARGRRTRKAVSPSAAPLS